MLRADWKKGNKMLLREREEDEEHSSYSHHNNDENYDENDFQNQNQHQNIRSESNVQNSTVPDYFLQRAMTESQPLTTHPLALNTAISALRFAIRHPLTTYAEVLTFIHNHSTQRSFEIA